MMEWVLCCKGFKSSLLKMLRFDGFEHCEGPIDVDHNVTYLSFVRVERSIAPDRAEYGT